MPQFDVMRIKEQRNTAVPYVVVLQSSRFDRANTRFVAPLVLASATTGAAHHLAPCFVVEGRSVVMDVFNLATIPTGRLGQPVASLADDESRARLIRALDELVSQAWTG